jgi:hypothetical protein
MGGLCSRRVGGDCRRAELKSPIEESKNQRKYLDP